MQSTYRKILFTLLAVMVLSVFIAGCGKNTVAKINDRKITRDEYYSRIERYRPTRPMASEVGSQVLQEIINEELIFGLAREEGVYPTDEQVKEHLDDKKKQMPDLDKQLKKMGISEEQYNQMARVEVASINLMTKGIKVTPEEVKKYYEDHKKDTFTAPEQAQVAYILAKDKVAADQAIALLKKGVDFGNVARQISQDKNTAAQDGRISQLIERNSGKLPPPIEDAIFNTEQGKYTKPISVPGGQFTVFKVLLRVPEKVQAFEDVEYRIGKELMITKGKLKNGEALQDKLAKFQETSKIDIKIERYKDLMKPKGGSHGHEEEGAAP